MSKCFIGIGKCSRFYKYIIFCIISNCLKDLSLYFTSALTDIEIMQSIYKYIGFLIIGVVLLKKYEKNIKKRNHKKEKRRTILLIYNELKLKISKIDLITLFLIAFFFALFQEGIKIINYFGFNILEFWTLDIIFILIFMHFYFPSDNYKHQTFSMIFITVFDSILLLTASLLRNYNIEDEDEEKLQNVYQNKGYFQCFFVFIVFINITFLVSFAKIKGKLLMDQKFLSPYYIIFLTGIFGLISNIIFTIILYIKDKNTNCCFDKDKKNAHIYCYGNIYYYFKKFKEINGFLSLLKEILLTFFYIIFYFINFTCEIFIIKYLNPNYILMSDNIYFEILKIVEFIGEEKKKLVFNKFIILQISELLDFIGCSIYLEIIELRFCGLNENIKRSISDRAIKDLGDNSFEYHLDEEEYEENSDMNSDINNYKNSAL